MLLKKCSLKLIFFNISFGHPSESVSAVSRFHSNSASQMTHPVTLLSANSSKALYLPASKNVHPPFFALLSGPRGQNTTLTPVVLASLPGILARHHPARSSPNLKLNILPTLLST